MTRSRSHQVTIQTDTHGNWMVWCRCDWRQWSATEITCSRLAARHLTESHPRARERL